MVPLAKTLNRPIQIFKPGQCDELGQVRPDGFTKIDGGDDWANISGMRGAEAIRAGALSERVQCSIRLRYRTDIVEGMYITDGEDIYTVRAVLPDRVQRRHVDLVCEVMP